MKRTFINFRVIVKTYEVYKNEIGAIYTLHNRNLIYSELKIYKGNFYINGFYSFGLIRISKKQYRRFLHFINLKNNLHLKYVVKTKIVYEKITL